MKIIHYLVSLSALSSVVLAFPSVVGGSLPSADVIAKLTEGLQGLAKESHEKRLLIDPLTAPVDGEQYPSVAWPISNISSTVTGDHSFIPPDFSAGDQRGPCPGLNALANHGYIGRNGVTSVGGALSYVTRTFTLTDSAGY